MKIAFPVSTDLGLESPIDQRFGRAPYFLIYDEDSGDFQVISNPALAGAHGVGPRVIQMLSQHGVQIIIAPSVGQNSFSTARMAGMRIYFSVPGTVKENLERYKEGKLNEITAPTRF